MVKAPISKITNHDARILVQSQSSISLPHDKELKGILAWVDTLLFENAWKLKIPTDLSSPFDKIPPQKVKLNKQPVT